MLEKRVQFSNIVQNQLPEYVRTDYPLISEFLKQYYIGQEYVSGPIDLIQNIDQYTKVDNFTNLNEKVVLGADLTSYGDVISVDMGQYPNGTIGFPTSYGLIKIDDEVITYTGLAKTAFTGCIRGFSGITSYKSESDPETVVFESTNAGIHTVGSTITNLSCLFLKEFLLKTKHQILPGLEERPISENVDKNIFIKQSKDFYLSKGTDRSFEILFKALYEDDVKIVRPGEFLFTPSNANFKVTNDLVVESIEGDPEDLTDATLYQDEYGNINKGYAPITKIEKIVPNEGGRDFYKIGFDAGYNRDLRVDGSLYGNFSVHPTTKLIGEVSIGQSTFDVDSTVGFDNENGEITVNYNDSSAGVVSYTSKSLTQFFGCSNVVGIISDKTTIGINTFAWGRSIKDPSKKIKIRINSVLSGIEYPDNTTYCGKNDIAKIKTLGIGATSFKSKNWFYNIASNYNVKSIELLDISDYTYKVTLNVSNIFRIRDKATIIDSANLSKSTTIINVLDEKTIVIRGQGVLSSTSSYIIKRNILKAESNSFPHITKYSTNVQNLYKEKYSDKILVASPSIPTYDSQPINTSDRSTKFSGTYSGEELDIGKHTFYSGDAIYYIPQIVDATIVSFGKTRTIKSVNSSLFVSDIGNLEDGEIPPNEGIYYIKRISSTVVKLARSRSDIENSKFISIDDATVTDCIFQVYDLRLKTLEPQNLFREIAPPENDGKLRETVPGTTGILKNGVEVLNYKSSEAVYYGTIKDMEVVSSGYNYDVINPPSLIIKDSVGTGATGYLAVSGSLKRIEILDSGFDYEETPLVKIRGGNGKGAVADVNMNLITHQAAFNSQDNGLQVGFGTTVSTIGFSTYHKFRKAEKVIYITDNQDGIIGLTTSANYFVSHVNNTTVKLHNTQEDAIIGINTVVLTSGGVGRHFLQSYDKKLVVEGINVVNPGSGYQNKKRTAISSGINTSINEITINNHGYENGEIVKYTTDGTVIAGLSTGTEYYITKVNNDKFKLSGSEILYSTKQYIDFTSTGSGEQVFNYQDISVSLVGKVGISSIGLETFEAQVQPIFGGEVTSVHLSNNGVGYGSSEIIDYKRIPEVSLITGKNAQVKVIVNDGKINEVVVLNGGSNYESIPDLVIFGDGYGAVITPIIKNGVLTEVKVNSKGSGYTSDETSVSILPRGEEVKFNPVIQTWNINLFKKYFSSFTEDDGFITSKIGLRYSHLYPPRKLRESVFAVNQSGEIIYGEEDLKRVGGIEIESIDHSPIIGWAYDGNPIYGPYGYSNINGGVVTQMKSGYREEASSKSSRPSLLQFPEGFFVEDFTYYEVSDESVLDENNGRFGITPEFPNGTYAYFSTINTGVSEIDGPFNKYKVPVFPYFIGNNFYSVPNEFNFKLASNQNDISLLDTNWIRNTKPYNLIENKLKYDYTYIPNNLNQTMKIVGVDPGTIDGIGIETGGNSYKIGDNVVFDNTNSGGYSASAKVSKILGKSVSNISVASSTINAVEIYPSFNKGEYIIFADEPHSYKNGDIISFSGLSTTSSRIGSSYAVGISSNELSLVGLGTTNSSSAGIADAASTGRITYLNVAGKINYPNLRENDILGIGTEKVKVLNIDRVLSRIKVIREYGGTVGQGHTAGTPIYEYPRKLTIDAGFKTTSNYKVNREIYFNPFEVAGLGTAVGIGTTITFGSNPVPGNPNIDLCWPSPFIPSTNNLSLNVVSGIGITQTFIEPKVLYLPNHGLKTGDRLTYSPNNGDAMEVWESPTSGVSTLTDGQTLYAAVIDSNLVGLATVKVGLGSTGNFVGIASTHQSSTTLFFSGIGTGKYHSLKTNYDPITANINRQLVTVATSQTHGLQNNDNVYIDVNPSIASTFIVKYNDYNRKILVGIKTFAAAEVNTTSNTITISDHGFVTGEKIVFGGFDNTATNNSPITAVWSNSLTASSNFETSPQYLPAIQAFDGSETTRAGNNNTSGGGDLTFTFTLNNINKVEVLTGIQNTVTINGSINAGTNTTADPDWVVYNPGSTFNLTEIKITSNGLAGYRCDLYAIKINGEVMIDGVQLAWGSGTSQSSKEGIYYIVKVDDNNFKLSDTYYNSTQLIPYIVPIVGFGSTSIGSIGPINPPLKGYKNSTIEFDLSDSSLSYSNQSTLYPAFQLNFYKDSDYVNLWDKNINVKDFNVKRTGKAGVDTSANVTLIINENTPEFLYYRLDPLYDSSLPEIKKEISIDSDVISNNEIQSIDSLYNGKQNITIASTTAFTYSLKENPERVSYASTEGSIILYKTDSLSALGEITDFEITDRGRNYYELPGITTITSISGKGADVKAFSNSLGAIKKISITDIGFDFSSDTTLSPSIGLPQHLEIIPLMSLGSVSISSIGRGYTSAPKLLVFDGKTKELVPNVDLKYTLGNSQVSILKNAYGLYNVTPTILPIHNTNGVGISSVGFNTTTNDVTVTMSVGFSTANSFPFSVNDKVMIEGISVGVGSTGKGYNSSNYDYKLFTLTSIDENLGGIGSVTYSLSNEISDGEFPGLYDDINSSGKIIPEKDFPLFQVSLKSNDYIIGETVKTDSASGIVDYWNNKTGVLRISSDEEFKIRTVVQGYTSKTQGIASSIRSYDAYANIDTFSKKENGWRTDSGVLNNTMQRVQDSDYYQKFSYALNSKVSYNTWKDVVSSLNHTLGFKKFSDYQLESSNSNTAIVGLSTGLTSMDTNNNLDGFASLNCVSGFDLVRENALNLEGKTVSTEIIFANRILQDYMNSTGNRVLAIDDVSPEFNSHPRPTKFSLVDSFRLSEMRARKLIIYVQDQRYYSQRQLMLVDIIHDGSNGYINQYGRVETVYDQGSFDFKVYGSDGEILFYPTRSSVNDYWITALSYNLDDNILGVGTTSIGDNCAVSLIETHSTSVPSGTTTTVVSIANTYSSAKILVEVTPDISMNDDEFEFVELNIVHNGSDVAMLEYGRLTTNPGGYVSSGYGTYYPYLDSSLLKVDFIPNAGIGTTAAVNTITVGLSSTFNGTSGVGTAQFKHTRLETKATKISASGSPTQNVVCEYEDDYNAAYFIAQVRDLTNSEYQLCEFAIVDTYDSSDGSGDTYDLEWANIETSSGLGTFGSRITGAGVGIAATVELVFTPNASIDTEVLVFMNALRYQDDSEQEMDFNNGSIQSGFGEYEGTDSDIKRAFNLTYNNDPIFERYFLGNDSSIVSTSDNSIRIPNHFYVSGEKIKYHHVGTATSAIGIGLTSFPGIGSTEYMPEDLFVVKVNDDTIRIATTAQNALLPVPSVVDITSVGIGTSHRFVATNQNTRIITALDNLIQSPIVSTAVTTTLADQVFTTTDLIEFSGITSFYGGDLIEIGSEIMKIEGVGIGSTNVIRVRRPWLGTALAGYGTGELVTKIVGNYNIVDNVLNFTEPPYGNRPIGSTTNPPDDRDWTGITTSSTFHGRNFIKSGIEETSTDAYYRNYVFDDISQDFNARDNTFTLKSNGSNITGITSESIILINDIWQGRGASSNYEIEESSGISSVTFTGTDKPIFSDVNISDYPVGGIIVSVGSTEGMGYQPLVAAGGTVTVSSAGTISSISIGYSGSGYRSGIGQTVNISIQQEDLTGIDLVAIGTAIIGSTGSLTGIAITNPHVFYKAKTISNVGYNSITGMSTVTTLTPHGLSVGNEVVLSGIAFTCAYAGPKSITGFAYSAASGIATVTTSTDHEYSVDQDVIFTGIAMTCGLDAGASTHYYPRGEDPAYDTSVTIIGDGTKSTVTNASYNPTTGVMTLTVPSHNLSNGDKVKLALNSLSFTCAKDDNATVHTYPRVTDPIGGQWVAISNKTTHTFTIDVLSVTPSTNTSTHTFVGAITDGITLNDGKISVNVGYGAPIDQFAHTFVSATSGAVISGGDYAHQFVSATSGAVISGGDYTHTFVSVGVGTITVTGIGSTTPTDATYTPSTGELVLTIPGHSYTTSNTVGIGTSALVFTCSMDNNASEKNYPRSTDPIIGVNTAITATTDNTITVNVGASPLVYFDVTNATYDGNAGVSTLTIGSHSLTTSTSVRLADNSLTFRCAMDDYASLHTYPRSTDPGFSTSINISSTTSNTITLDVGASPIVNYNVTAADYNANVGVMTMTIGAHTLKTGESIKLATESLSFTCTKDSGVTTHRYPRKPDPYYGGSKVTSVINDTQFVTNIGISTVETFYVSGGTVQKSIIAPRITDPARGQATVSIVLDDNNFLVDTGISTLPHFYARSGKVEKPLKVVFDSPLSYSNMPLIYSSSSPVGVGSSAFVDIQVGQGSSVIDFEIRNTGYGYGNRQILTVPVGGATGIPTTSGFKEFNLTVDKIFTDEFTGWSIGILQTLDNVERFIDGERVDFPLSIAGESISILAGRGSKIVLHDVLIVFVNDILQIPGQGYIFNGGSVITFTEALKVGDTVKISFYKGNGDWDVVKTEILETVKVGDTLTIGYDPSVGQESHQQEEYRTVTNVPSTNIVNTDYYYGPGNSADSDLLRPVDWCRQTEDVIIDGQIIGKDRELYEPFIIPFAYIIKSVGIGSTTIYVDNVRPFFDSQNENDLDITFQNKINFVTQESKSGAAATAIVSGLGTISSIVISDGGVGYTTATVSIASTIGIGTTTQAFGSVIISASGAVTGVAITSPGVGYTNTNVPQVLISPPSPQSKLETNTLLNYAGDSGVIVGVGTTTNSTQPQLIFDLFIPFDSELRNSTLTGTAVTLSSLSTNDYFMVFESNAGTASTSITSLDSAGSTTVGIGTSFIDNIYAVQAAENIEKDISGITTCVRRVYVNTSDLMIYGSGITTSNYMGEYSWGRMKLTSRTAANSYTAYTLGGIGTMTSGISTSMMVQRFSPLKSKNYLVE